MRIILISTYAGSRFVSLMSDKYKKFFKDIKFLHIDKSSQNIIAYIQDNIYRYRNDYIVVSEKLSGYFTYYAVNIMDIKSVIIDPLFFNHRGNLIVPDTSIVSRNRKNKTIILTKKYDKFDITSKFLKSNKVEYQVHDGNNVSNNSLIKIIRNIDTKLSL